MYMVTNSQGIATALKKIKNLMRKNIKPYWRPVVHIESIHVKMMFT